MRNVGEISFPVWASRTPALLFAGGPLRCEFTNRSPTNPASGAS